MKLLRTDAAPAAIGPYSQGVVSGGFVFVSGQIALDPQGGELVGDDVASQTKRVLENIAAVLRCAGTDVDRVVLCTVYLKNIADFPSFNEEYERFFGDHKPARVTVEVSNLPKGALVEISAIAEL